MPRPLGKTSLLVSPLSFGAFKIGRNEKIKYDQPYPLPTEEETAHLLNGVLDLGVSLIDTAPAYGLSEQRIGTHLAHRRKDFILSSKVGETFEDGASTYDFTRDGITASVERSLRRLKTDALDFLFLHSDGRDLQILNHTDAVETLRALKDRGLARFIGLSGKTHEGARLALDWADALMIEYHPSDTSHQSVINDAASSGVALLIKKPLASGKIPPDQAIPFILRNPHVATLVIGGLNLTHIRRNLEIAQRPTPDPRPPNPEP